MLIYASETAEASPKAFQLLVSELRVEESNRNEANKNNFQMQFGEFRKLEGISGLNIS